MGLVALSSAPAIAGTETSNLTVSATVPSNCQLTTTPLNFGNYDPIVVNASSVLDGTNNTAIAITCTDGTAFTYGVAQGQNPASGSTALNPLRQMANGAARLRYDLYRNSGRTQIWGDIGTANVRSGVGDGNESFFGLYGRIPAGQNVPVGNYSDTVTVTVSF